MYILFALALSVCWAFVALTNHQTNRFSNPPKETDEET